MNQRPGTTQLPKVISPNKKKQITFAVAHQTSHSPINAAQNQTHTMQGIAQSIQQMHQENDEASINVYKEAASKVVELQRQVISLRAKLKQKELVDQENEKLKRELTELKTKQIEM